MNLNHIDLLEERDMYEERSDRLSVIIILHNILVTIIMAVVVVVTTIKSFGSFANILSFIMLANAVASVIIGMFWTRLARRKWKVNLDISELIEDWYLKQSPELYKEGENG